jgi:hypothetical protein
MAEMPHSVTNISEGDDLRTLIELLLSNGFYSVLSLTCFRWPRAIVYWALAMARYWQRFSVRFLLEMMFVLGAGLAGWRSVYSGEAHRWPGFNVREGYWGTHFMDSLLYAIGHDRATMAIVSTFWFAYAALIALGLVVVTRFFTRRGPPCARTR